MLLHETALARSCLETVSRASPSLQLQWWFVRQFSLARREPPSSTRKETLTNIQHMANRFITNESSSPQQGSLKLKFCGSLAAIKKLTWDAGVRGNWTARPNQVWLFRLRNGAGMLWSSTKGTLWFDGPPAARDELSRVVTAALHRSMYPGTSTDEPMNGRL